MLGATKRPFAAFTNENFVLNNLELTDFTVCTNVHTYIHTYVYVYLCNSCILPWCATAAIKC